MEFFEKAHVARDKSMRKSSKSEELVKKQLKQMLYGYKCSNNEIISNSDKINDVEKLDDSDSVSGFSDLNITNTSNDTENVHDILNCNADNGNISNVELSLFNVSEPQFDNDVGGDEVTYDNNRFFDTVRRFTESDIVSENKGNSLSVQFSSEVDDSLTSNSSNDINFDTENESEKSSLFDADGALASKILQKLDKEKYRRKGKKRKLEAFESENVSDLSFLGPYKDKLGKVLGNEQMIDTDISIATICENEDSVTETEDSNGTLDTFNSYLPFISVTATEMADLSLSEILGEYRHPTIKNLPFEPQNIISSTHNSDIFCVKDLNTSQVQLEEPSDGITGFETNDMDDNEQKIMKDEKEEGNGLTDESTYFQDIDSTEPNRMQPKENSIDDGLHSEPIEIDNSDTELSNEKKLDPVKVFCKKNSCILILKHPVEIFIHGKVKARSIGGTVEVFGYTLKDRFYDIFAPYCNYAQYLKTVENPNAYYGLFGQLTSSGLSVAEAEEIVTSIGDQDGVVILKPLKNQYLDFIENNFLNSDLFNKHRKDVDECFKEASKLLGCSLYLSRPRKCLENNIYWNEALKCGFKKSSKGILCGGKGVGKSTSLRYFVNKLLADGPVLVIDLDPGQCEFTVAGNLSATVVTEPLLGPNFTHLKKPEMMLNLGMINTMDNLARYVAAVDELITYCSTKEQFKNMPWIINTMGLCNTVGLKFITFIIIKSQPTYILQLDSRVPKKRYEYSLDPLTIRRLYFENYQNNFLFKNITFPIELDYNFFKSVGSETNSNLTLAPREERYLNFLAYFGELISGGHSDSLLGITPYEVNLKDLRIVINVRINEEIVTEVINGKIVALCQYVDEFTGQMFILQNEPLLCHGHGLVRGVDLEKDILYIVTPLPVDKLSLVNTVLYADWVPELRGQEKHLPEGISIPYRTAIMYEKRQLMSAPRRRFNPLQLIKMTRKS